MPRAIDLLMKSASSPPPSVTQRPPQMCGVQHQVPKALSAKTTHYFFLSAQFETCFFDTCGQGTAKLPKQTLVNVQIRHGLRHYLAGNTIAKLKSRMLMAETKPRRRRDRFKFQIHDQTRGTRRNNVQVSKQEQHERATASLIL